MRREGVLAVSHSAVQKLPYIVTLLGNTRMHQLLSLCLWPDQTLPNRFQARALRIKLLWAGHQELCLQPLQQQWDVVSLCVIVQYKDLRQHISHLVPLCRPPLSTPIHTPGTTIYRNHHPTVTIPFARRESNRNSFLLWYSHLWNQLV